MKQTFILDGLNCANCAEEIRLQAEKIDSVESVDMNFMMKKLTLNFTDEQNNFFIDELKSIVKELEPEVNVIESESYDEADEKDKSNSFEIAKMVLSGVLLVVSLFVPMNSLIKTIIEIIAFILVGYPIVFRALKNMVKGNFFDENFLMSLASIGAFIIGICENIIKGLGWTTFSNAFTFVLLIIILMVKPTGLFGEKNIDKV